MTLNPVASQISHLATSSSGSARQSQTCSGKACYGNTELYFLTLDKSLKVVHNNLRVAGLAPRG